MTVDNELGAMWEAAIMPYCKELSQDLSGATRGTNEKLLLEQPMARPRTEAADAGI
jgi:hypothetical protein